MTVYTNFFGIDIGKFNFVVSIYGAKTTTEYEHSAAGIVKFIQENSEALSGSLSIIETTGGYEMEFIYTMLSYGYKVHRADTRKVKNFIRSFGNSAKTDSLDAKALAKYGYERHSELDLFKPACKEQIELFQLVQRRGDLTAMLVAEKNRKQSAGGSLIKGTIEEMISLLAKQIGEITDKIKEVIDLSPELRKKLEMLKTIPGVGDIVAFELLALLPELGSISRRSIASLAGVAPRSNESGKFVGYRRTGHGRFGVKRILFISAMAAARSKTHLKEFYEKLVGKGKKKMVALTALMRKILVIANARVKSVVIEGA